MSRLAFRNDADGFAFANSWAFDATERAALSALARGIVVPAATGLVAGIFPEPTLLATVAAVANAAALYPLTGNLSTYGLCGGMSFLAVDIWRQRQVMPRGAHRDDQPDRASLPGRTLRDLIWRRLLDSLGPGGALKGTVEWSVLLNQVPPWLGGGAPALLNRTRPQLAALRARIDAGQPCPIALLYTGRNIWDQHQILVHGYEDGPGNRTTLFVYDCNAPSGFGDTGDSLVTLDTTGPALVATTPSDYGNALAGFFLTNYFPMPLPGNLADAWGRFVRWEAGPKVFLMADGVRLPIASPPELAALGGDFGMVRIAPGAALPVTPRPRDGALMRERSSAPVFLYQGGAPFWIPDPAWLERFGGWGPVRVVPDGTLAAFAGPPDHGTLLREWNDPRVWRIEAGVRRWVRNPTELAKWGGFTSVRLVPDGALAPLPEGVPLPP